MRYQRSAAVLALMIPLILLLAIPGGAAPAAPGESLDGAPGSYLTGPTEGDPSDIALAYLRREAATLDLTAGDVADVAIASTSVSAHTGVTHVNIQQRHEGLDVFGAVATVSVAADGSVLFAAGSMVEGIAGSASGNLDSDAAEAVEAAADAIGLDEPDNLATLERSSGAARNTTLTDGGISDAPIPARLGWQLVEDELRLAWEVVIDDATDAHLWNAAVDADTGELLNLDDWTTHDAPEDLAQTLGRHNADSVPTAAAAASAAAAGGVSAADDPPASTHGPIVRAQDGSRYRVYEIPKNDANDGPRTVVTQPADATASPFGWHDIDGVPGPEFTTTQGNNVHAYSDRDRNNQPDPGSEPEGGPSLNFDFPFETDEDPLNYLDAAVTNLFYFCNMAHDVTYLYGFTEPFGNFQVNNYGRGGVGGDDVRCESQDGGGTNNANFSTPAQDGGRPRMQMFLWPGTQFGLPSAVTVQIDGEEVSIPANFARFTPSVTNAGTTGTIVLVDDGVDTTSDGCTEYTLPAGSIALVDNSNQCAHHVRVANAEAAGAVAVIVAHSTSANAPILAGSMDSPAAIPAVSITQANGDTLKAALPVAARIHRRQDRPAMRDSSFRNETILHEYGHGLSNRMTGGPTTNCLSGSEQMGEGWSDFLAIVMLLDPRLDDPEGPRGYGQYALFADTRVGPGFRVLPYSRNLDINEFTYDNIKTGGWRGGSIAAPHGVGWGYATVLWDMTWDLIDAHGLSGNIYDDWTAGGNNLSMQLVHDSLKLQGCAPTFVRSRDAILAADLALTGGENSCLIWNSWARRGLGYSAVGGVSDRNDGSQAFDLPPGCSPRFRLVQAQVDRDLRPELDALVAADGITLGLEGKVRHALDMFSAWIENPRQRGPAISHLERAIHLLLWQADVVDKGKTNQGDAAALRALAATLQEFLDWVNS